jgi:hypothetical protein
MSASAVARAFVVSWEELILNILKTERLDKEIKVEISLLLFILELFVSINSSGDAVRVNDFAYPKDLKVLSDSIFLSFPLKVLFENLSSALLRS